MQSKHKRALVWLRRDLRCFDNRAWSEAESLAEEIAIAFVFDTCILNQLKKDDRRITFIHKSLEELNSKLREKNSSLYVRVGDPTIEIPNLMKELKADALFLNRDYEAYAQKRDQNVKNTLEEKGYDFYSFKDHVIFEAEEVKNKSGNFFKVFTPYSKAWRAQLNSNSFSEAKVKLTKLIPAQNKFPNLEKLGFCPQSLYVEAGRKGAAEQFKAFKKKIPNYKEQRDFPALSATSQLSVHLRFGTLNIRELFRHSLNKDAGTFIWHNELIWREFYQMLLSSFPQLPEKCFQSKCDSIKWPGSKEHFQLWCEGQSGYPIIDASMRHFKKTGWMHNRLRMVVASFLTKDLLCHWKWGEAYFAENLLDFELASNNGGWQWAASVGCDAQPYFRIFNPTLQSERFDPEGTFIRQELPELKALPNKFIHAPIKAKKSDLKNWGVELGKNYPLPIVEHATQKEKAIKLFK
ncbi:MAG: deoxyribodipyrimidine photo-lyase [Bdellovibrionota bacterium]